MSLGGTQRRWRPASLCLAALVGVVVAAGCGDDGDESTAEEARSRQTVEYSAANEPVKVFVERLAKLLETASAKSDCAEIEDINLHSLTRFSCPPSKQLSKSMASFEVVDFEEYGTGAVVDYRSGEVEDGAAVLLFVAPDRRWGISRFGIVTEPSTKTSDEDSREGYAETVDAYLKAVRERDCEAYTEVVYTDASGDAVCDGVFTTTEELATGLQKDRSAKPRYLGGNATFGFYSIETEWPVPTLNNTTVSVIKAADGSPKPYMVLDAAPSVTSEEQERVRRAYRIQQEEQDTDKQAPGMQPDASSKPLDQGDDDGN